MSKKKFKSFSEVLIETFSEVYGSDSYNAVYDEFNGDTRNTYSAYHDFFSPTQSSNAQIDEYRLHPLILFTSFFGLPNRWQEGEIISPWGIIKKLWGWEEYKSTGKIIFNCLKIPIVLPFNLAMIIITTVLSIAKLVTEFLPSLLANTCKFIQKRAAHASLNSKFSPISKFFLRALSFITDYLGILFKMFYFIGKAVTSPVKGVTSAWQSNLKNGYLFAFLYAGLSLAITITAYAFLIPFAPVIAAKIGLTAIPAISTGVSTALSAIGSHVILPVIGSALSAIGASTSPVIAGLSLIISSTLTVVGPIASRLIDKFNHWYMRIGEDFSGPEGLSARRYAAKEISLSQDVVDLPAIKKPLSEDERESLSVSEYSSESEHEEEIERGNPSEPSDYTTSYFSPDIMLTNEEDVQNFALAQRIKNGDQSNYSPGFFEPRKIIGHDIKQVNENHESDSSDCESMDNSDSEKEHVNTNLL